MSDDFSNNNPKKEFIFALGGVGLFLGIVLLIGISGFLRPAGQHITAEVVETSVVADDAAAAETIADDPAASATVAAENTEETAVATDSAIATVEDASVTDADLTAEAVDADAETAVDLEETATAQ